MTTLLYYVTSDVYYPLEKGHELNNFKYSRHWHILLVKHIGETSQPEIHKNSDEFYCFWLRYQHFIPLTALVG